MFRDFDQSTVHDTSSVISAAHNKEYYKKNQISAIYREYDPVTGQLIEEGQFNYGVETGLWKVVDEDGHEQHFRYRQERIGARCQDGSFSSATGRGACSWHGGVSEWLHENKRYQVGGTGKYEPIEDRVEKAKQKLKDQLKINTSFKSDQQLLVEVTNKLLKVNPNPEKEKELEELLASKSAQIKSEYQQKISELQQIQVIIEDENKKLKQDKKQLQGKLAAQIKPSEKQKGYEEVIRRMKKNYQQLLAERDQELNQLKKDLEEAKGKKDKQKKKLDQSKSRSESENLQLKNQIHLIQQQLNLLNHSLQLNKTKEVSLDSDVSYESEDQKYEQIQKTQLKQTTPSQPKKTQLKVQTKPQQTKNQTKPKQTKIQTKTKQTKNQTKPKQTQKITKPELKPEPKPAKRSENLNQSIESSIPLYKQEQPSANSSISYSKILNSRLFQDESNKSDLSLFVDFPNKRNQNPIEKKRQTQRNNNDTKNDQKKIFRFQNDQQSSDEQNQITLRTDSEDQDENVDIFKSIPFKLENEAKQPTKDKK